MAIPKYVQEQIGVLTRRAERAEQANRQLTEKAERLSEDFQNALDCIRECAKLGCVEAKKFWDSYQLGGDSELQESDSGTGD